MKILPDEVERLLGPGRDHDVLGVGLDPFGQPSAPAAAPAAPDVPGRRRTAALVVPCSSSTWRTTSSTSSSGIAWTNGMPPASETTSGRDATANSARTSDADMPGRAMGVEVDESIDGELGHGKALSLASAQVRPSEVPGQ